MNDTGFKLGDSHRKRLAAIHSRKPEGLVATDIEIPQNPGFHMGGGGLYSTVGDYLKFTQTLMHGGTLGGVRVFKPETIATMLRNAIGDIRCLLQEPRSMSWPPSTSFRTIGFLGP